MVKHGTAGKSQISSLEQSRLYNIMQIPKKWNTSLNTYSIDSNSIVKNIILRILLPSDEKDDQNQEEDDDRK